MLWSDGTHFHVIHPCKVWWMVWQPTRVWMSTKHYRLYDWLLYRRFENLSRNIPSKWNVRQSRLVQKTAITNKDQQVQVENDWISLPIMKTIQATLSNMTCPFIRKVCLRPWPANGSKQSIYVMFDGYANGPTIKDVTHIRVAGGCAAPTVHVSEQTPLCL